MVNGDTSAVAAKGRIRTFKYFSAFSTPVIGLISFYAPGVGAFLLPMYVFLLVPVAELYMSPDSSNLSLAEEEVARRDRFYDWILYAIVPIQFVLLFIYLSQMKTPDSSILEGVGRTFSMGILCGVLGINVAHELGHRSTRYERILARTLLLSSLYMHFIIEHNRGHHRRVSTAEDPASARFGEPVYSFWMRTVFGSYVSAWKLEAERLRRRKHTVFSGRNEMVWNHLVQLGFVGFIYFVSDVRGVVFFLVVAGTGILLLETVNYIEHYGLARRKQGGRYERVLPVHSWNSDHVIGRLLLFELSRHSDHHFMASRKYQVLRSFENSPQMPTGYPGMILLALVPPLWYAVMHKRIHDLQMVRAGTEIQS